MAFELQPTLRNEMLTLLPLSVDDFEALYAVASDPLIWEQHPSKDRYRREVFETFFRGAIESGGAFKVIDNARDASGGAVAGATASGVVAPGAVALIGSSRYYDLDETASKVSIGYTFIARSHWAKAYNRALKDLMLGHAFRFVRQVTFHVGIENWRSRKAMEKLGGVLIGEESMAYFGEVAKPNVVYKIDAADWEPMTTP